MKSVTFLKILQHFGGVQEILRYSCALRTVYINRWEFPLRKFPLHFKLLLEGVGSFCLDESCVRRMFAALSGWAFHWAAGFRGPFSHVSLHSRVAPPPASWMARPSGRTSLWTSQETAGPRLGLTPLNSRSLTTSVWKPHTNPQRAVGHSALSFVLVLVQSQFSFWWSI